MFHFLYLIILIGKYQHNIPKLLKNLLDLIKRVCQNRIYLPICHFSDRVLNNSSDDRREEDVLLSVAKNLDDIKDVPEILRYALDDI